ncbi:MAG: hypothetical protein ACK4UP_02315 [Spirosomataceae bacterium]
MATAYPKSILGNCVASSKTAVQKYRELPSFARFFLVNREQKVREYELVGYQYCDSVGWYVVVDGNVYLVNEMREDEFFSNPFKTFGDGNPENDTWLGKNGTGVKSGTNEIFFDSVLGWYYTFNELGQRVYLTSNSANSSGGNFQFDEFIIPKIVENPDEFDNPTVAKLLDASDVVLDILKNPIVPKSPVSGLYESKEYFDTVRTKKEQYRKINQNVDAVNLYKRRLGDIVLQQNKLLRQIKEIEGSSSGFSAIASIFQTASAVLLPGSGQIGAASIQAVATIAEQRRDNPKLTNLADDFLYLQKEKEAIEKQILSSDATSGDKTWLYALIGLGIIVVLFILFRKRWLR